MSKVEAPATVRARVCVPNTLIAIAGWQERAAFSQDVVKAVLDKAKLKCAREAGSTACMLAYLDLTALASELEEVGYASCDGGKNSCNNIVSETAVAITAGLEKRQP